MLTKEALIKAMQAFYTDEAMQDEWVEVLDGMGKMINFVESLPFKAVVK